MESETLFEECPLCNQSPVVFDSRQEAYRCDNCGLTLKERSWLGIFKKGHFSVVDVAQPGYSLAEKGLKNLLLPSDQLKVVIGNLYTDQELAQIAGGGLDLIRPVRTVLAQIILEQLKEQCYLQVNSLRRGVGPPVPAGGDYYPQGMVPRQGLDWQDHGNLFGTDKHLVLPSNSFSFIRLDRKLAGVQAFTDGVAVQRKGDDFATYFVDCQPHEAALVAAFVMGKLSALRRSPST